jgi:hypothetical protein
MKMNGLAARFGAIFPARVCLRLCYLLLAVSPLSGFGQVHVINPRNVIPNWDTTMWVANGAVNALEINGNTVYLGGEFSYVGPNTGGGGVTNNLEGRLASTHFVRLDGKVYAALSDGKGGWYVGGSFTLQGETHASLVHLHANGAVDTQLDVDTRPGTVYALALHGNTLYAAGEFAEVRDRTTAFSRYNLMALDVATGRVKSWAPNVNGRINCLALKGDTLYLGGKFTSVAGYYRNRAAAFNLTSGQVLPWDPSPTSDVKALAVAGNTIYAGGLFYSIGGQVRPYLAALDNSYGTATTWSPNPSGYACIVNALRLNGTTLYVGGKFTTIGGQARNNLVAFSVTNHQLQDWNPNPNDAVNAIDVAGEVVYVGGTFTTVRGQPRRYAAAVSAAAGLVTAWNPNPAPSRDVEVVTTITAAGNIVYVGGGFQLIGGDDRKYLAAINAVTGQGTSWNPGADGSVLTLLLDNGLLYVGGYFSSLGGQKRGNLGAIDLATGQATPWNPGADRLVTCLVKLGNTVYAGGSFTSIGGQARSNLAAIDATTGLATPFNPGTDSNVYSLVAENGVLYAGGAFSTVGGQPRGYLAAIHLTTGQVTDWNANIAPGPYSAVNRLMMSEGLLYVGGAFNTVGTLPRNNLAAIDPATAQATAWDPNVNKEVTALAQSDGVVYAGGIFTTVGGVERPSLAAVDAATGKLTPWDRQFHYYYEAVVRSIKIANGNVFAAGRIDKIQNHRTVPNLVVYAPSNRTAGPNYIKGNVFWDQNANCVRDEGEKPIPQVLVAALPGPYYGLSDSSGNYFIRVDTGSYRVSQILPEDATRQFLLGTVCLGETAAHQVTFKSYGNTSAAKDFGNSILPVSHLTTSVASSGRRRCMVNTTTIRYCNTGSVPANGAKVYLQLPEYVVLKGADRPYAAAGNNVYAFDIGSLPANACGTIQVQDSVICNNALPIRGRTQCTKAWITPANAYQENGFWDGSDLTLQGVQLPGGVARIGIYNAGRSMIDNSTYRLYLNAQLVYQQAFRLAAGDSLVMHIPGEGRTVRVEADQRPGHPRKPSGSVALEAVGADAQGKVSMGYVALLPPDDGEPEVDIECLPITDSYDPNDKAVSPQGVTDQHNTPTAAVLQYVVRFQNTGTDVAYKVVVADTLSEHLDVSTLRIGAVSHPYQVKASGKGKVVLTFTFNNINLPDSTADEARSHGFIQFSIKPKAGLPEKTRIENFADIYFDYNDPVRTNTTFNTMYDVPVESNQLYQPLVCTDVNTSPQAGANRAVCEQDTVHLRAVAPAHGRGRWQRISGGGTIAERENAHAPVTGLAYGENVFEWTVAANPCSPDSLRARVAVTRYRNPATPVIGQRGADSLVCNVTGRTYEWLFEGEPFAGQGQAIRVTRPGTYRVRVTDEKGCSSALSPPFAHVLTHLEPILAAEVALFPNPGTGKFTLLLPALNGQAVEISVWDARGRLLETRQVRRSAAGRQPENFDLSHQPAGVFLVKVQTPKGVVLKKVIKK